MRPIFGELMAVTVAHAPKVKSLQALLEMVPTTPLTEVATAVSDGKKFTIVKDTEEEIVVMFALGSISVRLMQCRDLDVTNDKTYDQTARAKRSCDLFEADTPVAAYGTWKLLAVSACEVEILWLGFGGWGVGG
jgi:hypothetical protein